MRCPISIDPAVLAEYWLAALTQPDEEAVEEHLFHCDQCGGRLREIIAIADGIRKIALEGSLRMIVSETFLGSAERAGLNIRQYAPPPGGGVNCTVTAEDHLLVARLAADLAGSKRVDLSLCDENGIERRRLIDIPIPSSGAEPVIYHESITFAKEMPTNTMIARLVTVDETDQERLLAEYTFHHTRSMPGTGTGPAFEMS